MSSGINCREIFVFLEILIWNQRDHQKKRNHSQQQQQQQQQRHSNNNNDSDQQQKQQQQQQHNNAVKVLKCKTDNITNSNNNNNNNNNESNELLNAALRFVADEPSLGRGEHLPFWDAYDVVNQLYLELGNKAEVQSHYRGHKLSMWLNLIPQLHKHSNINDQSMRHHQFPDDISNRDLYEGVVRPQMQTKPPDDEDTVVVKTPKSTTATKAVSNNTKTGINTLIGATTTECNPDGTIYANIGDSASTQQPAATENRTMLENGGQQKDLATASTGLIGNLEMFRRLSGKQFPSYTTALVATVAVGCFLLTLNILIFAGIYHQREKRARDAKTKEELQDTNETSKTASILKLNTLGDDDGSMRFDALTSGKSTVVFSEYNYYDEKPPKGCGKDEKLLVELPPTQTTAHMELNWPGGGGGSSSTLDLLKTKHHSALEAANYSGCKEAAADMQHLQGISNIEMATYSAQMPLAPGIAVLETALMPSRRSSFMASGSQTSMQFDYAVQSSDQLSFKEIENAVKVSNDDIVNDLDDDIPEPPPPPRSFQSAHLQQQQQQQQQQQGGILRSSGSNTVSSTSGKKRVHIQEISV
uniref:Neuroligin-1 n=1 Tax=Bactrocera latifrons TaxID=174628 RepID=A0A0K8U6Y3_BACLA